MTVAVPGARAAGEPAPASVGWRRVVETLRHRKLAMFAVAVLVCIVACALFAPLIAPHNPTQQNLATADLPPGSANYLLGTDQFGRDILSRILYGGRLSLLIGVVVASSSAVSGALLGMVAGIAERAIGSLILRTSDILFSLPFYVVAIALAALFGPGIRSLLILLVIWGWPTFARTVAVSTAQLKRSEFVAAARLNGMRWLGIMWRHILPNVLSTVIVLWSTSVGVIILTESALSFIGLGVQAPSFSWGSMLAGAQTQLLTAWWVGVFPGLALTVTILATYILGDALRDAVNPAGGISL